MTLRLMCCLFVLAARWVESTFLFCVFVIAEALKVCIRHTEQSHLMAREKNYVFLVSISLQAFY